MQDKKKSSRSNKRAALLASLFFIVAIPLFLYLSIPTAVPAVLAHYLKKSGGRVERCEIIPLSAGRFSLPDCRVIVPWQGAESELRLQNGIVEFSRTDLFPSLRLELMEVRLPKGTHEEKTSQREKVQSAPNLYFSNLSIRELRVIIGDEKPILLQSVSATQAEGSVAIALLLKSYTLPSPAKFSVSDVNVQGKLENNELRIRFQSETSSFPAIKGSFRHETLSATGEFFLEPIELTIGSEKKFDTYFDLPKELQILSGELEARAHIEWVSGQLKSSSLVELKLKHLNSNFREFLFEDINGNLPLIGYPNWHFQKPAALSVSRLRAGLEFQDVQLLLGLNFSPPQPSKLSITELHAKVLGGTLFTSHIDYTPGEITNFQLEANDIDLAQVLSLGGEAVRGTGRISGVFPFEIDSTQVRLIDGKLHSNPPGGELHYVSAAKDSANNPGLTIALQALEEFYYESMEAKLLYSPEGTLTADIALTGKNPHLFNGRQINFNVNVEENVPALIRSIRLATQAGKDVWSPEK